MKKIFPVIIVLITLSLIGTIYVQYSWLRTMLADKQEEFKRTVYASIDEVGKDLMEQRNAIPNLKNIRSKPGFRWPSAEFNMELMRPPTISQKFTWYVVEEKLKRSFNSHGLKNLKFEFAVVPNVSGAVPELKSRAFMKELDKLDSVNTLTLIYPFAAAPGSDFENLVPDETMYVLVPDIKGVALRQMHWMIIGAVFFTLMIITAFYVTVSALLRQKKMSEIKNDFINNMTHEFKTPLATISLAVDALRNEKVIED
ncbi:MAG: sensor histidine kinase, partial [Chitinophagaceae bacterium]